MIVIVAMDVPVYSQVDENESSIVETVNKCNMLRFSKVYVPSWNCNFVARLAVDPNLVNTELF